MQFWRSTWKSFPLGRGLAPIQRFYLILWLICCLVYWLNQRTNATGDSISHTLALFNLLENHTIYADNFVAAQTYPNAYWFIKNIHDHWVYLYPIGTAILTAPIYFIFYLYLKIVHAGAPLDITATSFEVTRQILEKLSAMIVAASSATLFFAFLRRRFNNQVALITTLIFAFATNSWVTSSQALWQHGPLNFVVIAIMWNLLVAQQADRPQQQIKHLLLAGLAAGLMPGIRPPALLYTLAGTTYALITWRKRALAFLVGLLSSLPSLIWNFYHFGNATGGYSIHNRAYGLEYFPTASLALFFSPSRGLFVYSPILLFAIPGVWILWRSRQKWSIDWLNLGLLIASLGIGLSYCFFFVWWAGNSYGPRFLVDVLPILCVLIAHWLYPWLKSNPWRNYRTQLFTVLFCITAAYSTGVQFIGVLNFPGNNFWDNVPVPLDRLNRAWDWQDNPMHRQWQGWQNQSLSKSILKTIKPRTSTGRFISLIQNDVNQPIHQLVPPRSLATTPFTGSLQGRSSGESVLQIFLQNANDWNWYGYDKGMLLGEQVVSGTLYDQNQAAVGNAEFTVTTTIKPQATGMALGLLQFPANPGNYTMRLDLTIRGLDAQTLHIQAKKEPLAVIPVIVQP